MKYEITEEQYRKVILNYLDNIVGELNIKEKVDNYIDVHTTDGTFYGTLWFKERSKSLPNGCKSLLSLGHNFMGMFAELIPDMDPKIFSEVSLEYFAKNSGIEPQCIDFSYPTGEINDNGRPKVQFFIHNTKKR